MTNIVRYSSRTFGDIKTDLIAYIKQQYPEVLSDFTDSSVGSMLIDINAGVNNNLSMNIDRAYQETTLENAQLRKSMIDIAKNLGFNVPNKRPSVTIVDLTVSVPVLGDAPDPSYYPTLAIGAQIMGGGKIFETQDVIDWSIPVSNNGDPNRSIIPNYNANGNILNYSITKREVVLNGSSNIFKRVINSSDVIPFFSITLPDQDILEIESIILKEGTNNAANPTNDEFNSADAVGMFRYYEVDYLAQPKIFVENTSVSVGDIKSGKWIDISKKFIKEFTSTGYCKIIFGSGDSDVDTFKNGFIKNGITNKSFLDNFLSNTALGDKLKENYTLYVKYRTGGGVSSNIGANVLTQLGSYTLKANGSRQDFNNAVTRSLKVTNPIAAIGGNDGLSIDQIRELIRYNFSSQNRCVALKDYLVQLYKMQGKFGSPFRANTYEMNNKVIVSMIGVGSDSKLSNTSNAMLKENIAEYLSGYRMVNDFIEIRDGRIYNIAIDIDVYVNTVSDNQIANNIINAISSYFNVNNHDMNEDIFIGKLNNIVAAISGVNNVIGLKIYNKVGGNYSVNAVSQAISDTSTGEIVIVNNTVYSDPDSMFEIKFPEQDIRVYLRKRTDM
jgi:hypothetical protein